LLRKARKAYGRLGQTVLIDFLKEENADTRFLPFGK